MPMRSARRENMPIFSRFVGTFSVYADAVGTSDNHRAVADNVTARRLLCNPALNGGALHGGKAARGKDTHAVFNSAHDAGGLINMARAAFLPERTVSAPGIFDESWGEDDVRAPFLADHPLDDGCQRAALLRPRHIRVGEHGRAAGYRGGSLPEERQTRHLDGLGAGGCLRPGGVNV